MFSSCPFESLDNLAKTSQEYKICELSRWNEGTAGTSYRAKSPDLIFRTQESDLQLNGMSNSHLLQFFVQKMALLRDYSST